MDRTGCPQCTHYASCDQYNVCLDAAAAATVLRATIAAEAARDEAARDDARDEDDEVDATAGEARGCCAGGGRCRERTGGFVLRGSSEF